MTLKIVPLLDRRHGCWPIYFHVESVVIVARPVRFAFYAILQAATAVATMPPCTTSKSSN
jgi:hypothetical protein